MDWDEYYQKDEMFWDHGEPHASLLYKKLPVAAKKELASTIRLPFREVAFDAIKTIRCASATRTGNDVEAWRVAIAKSLRE
jgi:hypothetical protein